MPRISLTCRKRAVVTLVSVDAAATTRVLTRGIASTARPWSVTVEPYVNCTQHNRFMALLI